MQRGIERAAALSRRHIGLRHSGRAASPQPSRPALTPLALTYRVHVRNTSEPERGTWATYIAATRELFKLTKADFARRIGVDRGTVHRWEIGQRKPEDPRVIQRVAEEFELDLDEALAAAGLRPMHSPPTKPSREPPMAPELLAVVRLLADPNTSPADKEYIRRALVSLSHLPPADAAPRSEGG